MRRSLADMLTIIALMLVTVASGKRILLIPAMWASHILEISQLGRELVHRGHDVHMLMSETVKKMPNSLENSGVNFLRYSVDYDADPFDDELAANRSLFCWETAADLTTEFEVLDHTLGKRECGSLLNNMKMFKRVVSMKFDIAIVDGLGASLCRYDGSTKEMKISENIHIVNWMPQNDILGHPNTRLFVTHCGNNGRYEALYHGIPMLVFPFDSDQPVNAIRLERRGFGLRMDMKTFKPDELAKNMHEIIENPRYKNAIQKSSDIFRDLPNPREKAASVVEHVMKHGADHWYMPASELYLYEIIMLDIVLAIVFLVFCFIMVLKYFIVIVCMRCISNTLTIAALMLATVASGKRILLIPAMWASHILEISQLGRELVHRGHDVHMLMSETVKKMPNSLKNSGVKFLRYSVDYNVDPFDDELAANRSLFCWETAADLETEFEVLDHTLGKRECRSLLNNMKMFKQVVSMKFDIAIVDGLE
ncbi:uncharacterized protein LOC141911752 [Tubulanus polymorphus]|uniref:uncharacterized protein LOC141911752 n=1 Tax=Tubulanus polymorphus TaxID=672921 RepID=UPI003DA24BD0